MAFSRIVRLYIGPEGDTGTLIKDNYISFRVEKSTTEALNKGECTIYNLSDDTIKKLNKVGNKLKIEAGYADENNIAQVFFGDIARGEVRREAPNRALSLFAADGRKKSLENSVTLSYKKDSSVTDIFNKIVNALDYPLGGETPQLSGKKFTTAFAFTGLAVDALKLVLSRVGYKYSIQNEQVYILKADLSAAAAEITGLKLTYDSGVIAAPEQIIDDSQSAEIKDDAPAKWRVRSLLFPQLVPGSSIVVKAGDLDGTLLLESVVFQGDNFGGEFSAECEGTIL